MNDNKKAVIVVLFLIALTVVAYPFTSTEDNWQIYGIQNYSFFQEGKFEPLITAIFTHLDEWHIFGNMIFLFVFGITLAVFIGWKKFLIVYFIGGIVGNLAWVIYPIIDESAVFVTAAGASGAVFAVMATLVMAKPKNAVDITEKSEILKFFPHVPWLGL
ncbi:MAG: rhomboid family intramembrane serine protease, partial [Candidatus Altarchaeum sp.]|nr:rhomboid family intramembrane serine protease [Candidatus Altarchaeum sp.]